MKPLDITEFIIPCPVCQQEYILRCEGQCAECEDKIHREALDSCFDTYGSADY